MELFLIYLVKCSSFLGIFYLSYILFLKKETFFKSNRLFLIGGIIASLLLPFAVFKKVIWITPSLINEQAVLPIKAIQNDIVDATIDWWFIAGVVYLVGLLFFLGKLVMQIASLLLLFKKSKIIKKEGVNFVKTTDNISPFSFFNYIVYNPNDHTSEELKVIIKHEKTHSKQLHSIDILSGHFISVFLWINPFSWLYKKVIAQNLEYIADNATTSEVTSTKEYQYMLLKVATQTHQYSSITSNFFNSLIKKRIVMLNQQQSQKYKAWKYVFILPLLAAFIMSFNTETIYKTKNDSIKNAYVNISSSSELLDFIITKNTTDKELNSFIKNVKKEGYILKFNKIKRNSKGEIVAINASLKDKNRNTNYITKSNEPISSFTVFYNHPDGNFGFSSNEKNIKKRKIRRKLKENANRKILKRLKPK